MSAFLTGHVIIVTGGGRGIGRAMAEGFAATGARVVVAARTGHEITAVAKAIAAQGGQVLPLVADVGQPEDVARLVAATLERWGRIDTLVNNAAVPGPQGAIHESDPAAVAETWRVNVMGAFLCCRAVVPAMSAQGGGNIINISSGAGQRKARQGVRSLAYQVSKFGLEGLTNGLATQLRDQKINVNSLLPGMIPTRLHAGSSPEWLATLQHKAGRLEDVVNAACFLATRLPGAFTDNVIRAQDVSADWQHLQPAGVTGPAADG